MRRLKGYLGADWQSDFFSPVNGKSPRRTAGAFSFSKSDIDKSGKMCYHICGLPTIPPNSRAVAVASSIKEEVEYLLPSSAEGGDIMEYITWRDLIDIAALIIAIMSLLKSNKKR